MVAGPLLGNLSDAIGKVEVFSMGSVLAVVIILIYCNLGPTPFWLVIVLNTALMMGVMSRLISSAALITAVPEINERGAFMSINSSLQQISGGIASVIAGLIIVQTSSGILKHYDLIGYIVVACVILTIIMMRSLNRYVVTKTESPELLQSLSQSRSQMN